MLPNPRQAYDFVSSTQADGCVKCLSALSPAPRGFVGDLWQHWTRGRDVFDKLLLDADWALNNGASAHDSAPFAKEIGSGLQASPLGSSHLLVV